MKIQLNDEQNEVIIEYLNYLKSKTGIVSVGMVEKKMKYDFVHGKGQAVELLNANFYNIIELFGLSENQIKRFAREISLRENKWIAGTFNDFDFDDVVFDGYGYVVISDGTRIDIDSEIYKQEREEFNKSRLERLKNNPISGKEYL